MTAGASINRYVALSKVENVLKNCPLGAPRAWLTSSLGEVYIVSRRGWTCDGGHSSQSRSQFYL